MINPLDEDIKVVLAEVKYEFLYMDEALSKIKAIQKKEMENILKWGCRQGYDEEPGIKYEIQIMGVAYTIPEAIELYLNKK